MLTPSLVAGFLLLLAAQVGATPIVLDAADAPEKWNVSGSDGVIAAVTRADGPTGSALQVDFDFKLGSGFFVFRREVDLELPASWRFSFDVRGPGPVNNLEFKLIDETGDNVWWVNQRAYEFPAEWTRVNLKKRHFRFAWGPGGPDKPLKRVKAIEIAVAAGTGGSGRLLFDNFTFEELPEVRSAGAIKLMTSSCLEMNPVPQELPASGVINWRSAPEDREPFIELDLGGVREIGGISLDWSPLYAMDYDIRIADADGHWGTVFEVRDGRGGFDHIPLREAEATKIRLEVKKTPADQAVLLQSIRVRDVMFSENDNAFMRAVASESPRGRYPRGFIGEQSYWNVVGAPGAEEEGLLSEDGALEMGKGGPTIEPFLLVGDRMISWADAKITHTLPRGFVPHPMVRWEVDGLSMEVRAADRLNDPSRVSCLYTIRNTGTRPAAGFLALTVRPFQAMPATQDLNMTGGVARIRSIQREPTAFQADGRIVSFSEEAWSIGATPFASSEIADALFLGLSPEGNVSRDPLGLASGAALFEFELGSGEEKQLALVAQIQALAGKDIDIDRISLSPVTLDEVRTSVQAAEESWAKTLAAPVFKLPPAEQRYADTFHSQVAYILVNRDGPAIQPGSRAYDRTWIRDGALTSTALLYAGRHEEVREFVDWFKGFQYENGKIPCCADERGPDPVPENDSHGQYIYAVAEYDRFMHDEAFLAHHLPHVVKAVEYIESLRAMRMTDAYRNAEGLERAKYGLMPESISHEGYSAKPMHSYWDDFWTLRGLDDAVYIAQRMDDGAFEAMAEAAAESMRQCLYDSMRLAIKIKGIDYIPGCVELGDFDATSTSIGVFPIGELGSIPEPQLSNTFARYATWFEDRAAGRLAWKDYTPYEIRNTTTYLFLGRREVAHHMMDFLFADQRPAGWNMWAEVVRNGERTPGFLGDMPHTWVGSDFVKLLRTMFVHEGKDGALVLGMGIPRAWEAAPGGAAADGLPTHFGTIGVSFFEREGSRVVQIRGELDPAPSTIVIALEDLEGASITADGAAKQLTDGRLVLGWPVREVVISPGEGKSAR